MVKAKLKKIMSILKYQLVFLFKLEIQSTNFVVFASRDTLFNITFAKLSPIGLYYYYSRYYEFYL